MHSAELDWLKQAQKGDDLAFARLVEAYEKPVYNLCYRMLGNAGDAEDAAQETFIRAYKAIRRYDPTRKFSTWLLTIASNYCIDQHRRRLLLERHHGVEAQAHDQGVDRDLLQEVRVRRGGDDDADLHGRRLPRSSG